MLEQRRQEWHRELAELLGLVRDEADGLLGLLDQLADEFLARGREVAWLRVQLIERLIEPLGVERGDIEPGKPRLKIAEILLGFKPDAREILIGEAFLLLGGKRAFAGEAFRNGLLGFLGEECH